MSVLVVNGAAMATPSELKVELMDVGSDGQRSASGSLVVDRVAVKRRLRLKWPLLGTAEMGALLGAVGGSFFTVTCPDPEQGTRTMTCRCGERAAGVLRMLGGEPVWTDIEMVWEER